MFEQINLFNELEELLPEDRQKLRRALRCGSGFENGKERIREKASVLSKKDFITFLKNEYGVWGRTFEDGFIGSTSMHFYMYKKNWNDRKTYSWAAIADEIYDMLNTNSY